MMRTAVFISQLIEGDAGRLAADLSLHLSEKNECFVVVDNSKKVDYAYGGDLVGLDSKNILKKIYQLKHFKRDYAIATMISIATWPNLANIFTKSQEKVLVSVQRNSSFGQKWLWAELEYYLKKILYRRADLIVVPLKSVKKDLLEDFKLAEEKIKVIPNPINLAKIAELAGEKMDLTYRELYSYPVVITVGRLARQKGHRQLIKAFKVLKGEIPGAKLLILGEGEMRDNLVQLVLDLNLERDVVFGGIRENPYKHLAGSVVAVFPSVFEDYPHELCEAMACGVPVIAADCPGGVREILAPETEPGGVLKEAEEAKYGTLIPVCNDGISNYIEELSGEEMILSQCLIKAIKEQDFYRKRAAQALERVRDFDWEKIMALWDKLL